MKSLNPRIARLQQMMALEEKRISVQQELDLLLQQLSVLKDHLFDEGSAVPVLVAKSIRVAKPAPAQRGPRGFLKEKITAALVAAGSAGVKVKELAVALNTKPVNIHSWFHSALKRDSSITKLVGGHYRLNGGSAAAAPKVNTVKPAKAAKTVAVTKGKSKKGAKRGQLSATILAALKEAGDKGITVADLAEKMGAKYKNVYIWFATTGKKQPGLKKLAPAKYKLTA